MSDIFLSYASEDRERVRPLVEALTREGWSVFWDRIIPVGEDFYEVLEEELKAARSLVVVWTRTSIKSKWVREELTVGKHLRLPLFPVLLDEVRPPLGFTTIQAADLSTWDGAVTYPAFLHLVRDVKNRLGEPGQPGASTPAEPAGPTTKTKPTVTRPTTPPSNAEAPEGFANNLGMTFVLVQDGTFQMGSPAAEDARDNDEQQHLVTLSRPFYLQTTPVTQGQWLKVRGGKNPSYFQEDGADCPVEQVSWDEAREFIARLNRLKKTDTYRLPTEAEWEYACRAGSTTSFYLRLIPLVLYFNCRRSSTMRMTPPMTTPSPRRPMTA